MLADEQAAVGPDLRRDGGVYEVRRETQRVAVCAIQVQGVPDISVEEAIWNCVSVLRGGQSRRLIRPRSRW